jgi:hypothetical protein
VDDDDDDDDDDDSSSLLSIGSIDSRWCCCHFCEDDIDENTPNVVVVLGEKATTDAIGSSRIETIISGGDFMTDGGGEGCREARCARGKS